MKTVKKAVGLILVMAMLFPSVLSPGVKMAKADTISDATPYVLGSQVSGMLTENGSETKTYKFSLASSGKISITGTAYMKRVYLHIYDADGNEIAKENPSWNNTTELIAFDYYYFLNEGEYYFTVERDWGYYGNYNFKIDFTSSNESFREEIDGTNNSIATANTINPNGSEYIGQISDNDDKDFYKFALNESGKIDFKATFVEMYHIQWNLYDEAGNELVNEEPYWNETTQNIVIDDELYLTSGIYYISISKTWRNSCGAYKFSLKFKSSGESFAETNGGSNNSINLASKINLGTNYVGQLAINDDKDFYNFSINSSQNLAITVTAELASGYIRLYDSEGNELWNEHPYWNEVTKKINFKKTSALEKGKYYIVLEQDWRNSNGKYTLNISKLTQSNCPHEDIRSTWHDSTYFTKGYRENVCSECGYTYKTDYSAVKELSQGYLYSYCTTGKGSLKLSWSTIYDASGYEIRYSRNKSFKSGVKSVRIKGKSKYKKTISKLSRKKKYYVQIRAYKTAGSKTVYGKWSGKRCLKTK